MAQKIGTQDKRLPHFIREWRKYRGVTQERLADTIGSTSASLSRIETGIQPYTQDSLELIARALDAKPADLLAGPPQDEPPPTVPLNEALLGLLMAAVFEHLGMAETGAAVVSQAVLELAAMPAHELEGIADRAALTKALASFALRQASLPRKQ